jgi:hypothetical protein
MLPRDETCTYLLHFEDRHRHAQHLLWYDDDPAWSVRANELGFGPGLVGAMRERGVPFVCVRVWHGGKEIRRELRRAHNNRRWCPLCLNGRARQLRLF